LFGFGSDAGLEVVGVEMNFAGCDLFLGCAVEAELADAEAGIACIILSTKRRTEDAAGHGAGGIEVAESGGGIENGAGLVVGEVFELRVVDEAGVRVAGKKRSETSGRFTGALADGRGAVGIDGIEGGEAFAETGGVQLGDGKDADAALRASGSAEEEGAGAAGGIGNGGVDDVDELGVAGGEHRARIADGEERTRNEGDEEFVI
jgi:hypothetical protein